ncbi:MAG: helix-turn-helix transcriptional regulator [Flavobacteriaceae bacterium]|nr:helix-turn-helix transcriptional regulator [Flavobacteriaceae bacterium]
MFDKRLKAADLARGTKIPPSIISRYLSGKNNPSTDNIMTIGNYLGVHPQSLLSSSDASESISSSQGISSSTDSLLKVIEVQGELIKHLQKQVKEWEDWKAGSKARHAKGKAKADQAISKNKQKLGFLKKHKPKK